MNYALVFNGAPGEVGAVLTYDGKTIATGSGLKDGDAARKWGKKAALAHKTESALSSHTERVVIQGESTFSV